MGWDGAKRTMEDGAGLEAEGRAGEEPGCWRSNLRGRKGRDPEGRTGRREDAVLFRLAFSCREQQRTEPLIAGLERSEVVP